MSANTKEKDFQNTIVEYLSENGYKHRDTEDYVKNLYLDCELVLHFVKITQEKEWKKFEHNNKNPEKRFFYLLVNEIRNEGTIHVLRNGFKDSNARFQFFYPKPNNYKNPELFENFNSNIFSVIDELEYEDKENGNRLDLGIFVNGIPISTIELKDTFSQGVSKAIKQYKFDRDPREQLFKNCLVHFAMSDEKIYMTTSLRGGQTQFLPFNRGIENPVIDGDYKTSYLYKNILSVKNLSNLISNFIFNENGHPIFPRYHQLDCVNLLINQCKPGTNYLIQHSAGSGKTKTIAWLAHQLLNKFDVLDNRVYNMVVVISDRKVIDEQLQDQIKSIQKKKGIVEVIDKDSSQLAESLKSGSNIVVTTLQKFPYILDETQDLPNRKYAVIIDEAHSSQTGSLAREMHKVLGTKEIDEEALEDAENEIDELIIKSLEQSRNMDNISFFAFTATPKNKTLEMFGTPDDNGEFHPFHIYSMQQAIAEGFILNILKFYLTCPTYFKLMKTVTDDPEFVEDKAKKVLKKFVEKHPHPIHVKTDIALTHFMNSTYNKIDGKARAMFVTGSRLQAVMYKKEFDKQIKENGYNIKALVAFTGTVKHKGVEYTEKSMNNINGKLEEVFEKDQYKILIVANKYQTGFDEPLLHTMYVDKKLRGVQAVQTLSRLNRIAKDKHDTLILDFANSEEDIQKAFEPYYGETFLSSATDPHKLYELEKNLFDYEFFYPEDVNEFVIAYLNDKTPQAELHNLLNPAVQEFKKVDEEKQVTFKKTLRKYQSMYSFLSQLMPFSDKDLEKLYIYTKFLNKKLPAINNPLPFNVQEDVDIDSYKVKGNELISIDLNSDGELNPASNGGIQFHPEEKNRLSEIIKDLNEAFGTNFSEDDKVLLKQVKNHMANNEELTKRIQNNSKENVEAVFGDYFEDELNHLMTKNFDFFQRISDNEKLRTNLQRMLLDLLYEEKRAKITS